MTGNIAGGRERPEGKFEAWAWLFMRLSGLILIFLALGHLTIMHLIHSIDEIDYSFVAKRFTTPLWRGYDFFMLFLAMLHGTNGMRVLVDDYIHAPRKRLATLTALYFISFALLLLGAWVLFTFQPVTRGVL